MSTQTPSNPSINQPVSIAHSNSWASHNGKGDVRFEYGKGVWLYNSQGEAYLDAVSGTFNLPLGYSHPVVLEAVRRQQERVVHGFIRDIAILRFAPQRDSPVDTQRGADERLQVWPLVLALAIRNRKGHRLLLGLCLL